jgi:hypothetical protein
MCGDLEPEDRIESDLYQRFRVHSQAMLEQASKGGEMHRYLDGLFKDVLRRCVADADRADGANSALAADQTGELTGYRTMAMQSLVLARLAGFLAGQVALNEDPMRKVMEAVMHGYGEAEAPPERDHHGHAHDGDEHGHHHGH